MLSDGEIETLKTVDLFILARKIAREAQRRDVRDFGIVQTAVLLGCVSELGFFQSLGEIRFECETTAELKEKLKAISVASGYTINVTDRFGEETPLNHSGGHVVANPYGTEWSEHVRRALLCMVSPSNPSNGVLGTLVYDTLERIHARHGGCDCTLTKIADEAVRIVHALIGVEPPVALVTDVLRCFSDDEDTRYIPVTRLLVALGLQTTDDPESTRKTLGRYLRGATGEKVGRQLLSLPDCRSRL